MKINSELERVLLGEQTKLQKKPASPDNSAAKTFGSFFENELDVTSGAQAQTASSSSTAQANSLSNPLNLSTDRLASSTGAQASTAPMNEKSVVESLVSGIQNMVEEMDTYSSSVQNATGLKQAWANLSTMSQNIGAMQKDYAKLSNPNPSMGSMLNSLEVLTVTETYKFNRGDYS